MMLVRKKQRPQRACRLGDGTALEQELRQRGLLLPRADGLWELITREAPEHGEIIRTGDYIKLDSLSMPYPNDPEFFRARHTHLEGEWYLQQSQPVQAWTLGAPMDAQIRFLVDTGRLVIAPEHGDRTFSAFLWGALQTAAYDAAIILSGTDRDPAGEICDVRFHMVAWDEFLRTYDILSRDP